MVKFASSPRVVEQWARLGCFCQRDPPKSAGACETTSCLILVQELLPNTTLGTYLEHSKALSPCCGSKGKNPLRWDAVEKSTGYIDPLLRSRLC